MSPVFSFNITGHEQHEAFFFVILAGFFIVYLAELV
jgi:hypothetical protein